MKIAFLAAPNKKANQMRKDLTKLYGKHRAERADILVVLGGDGFMLHTLHQYIERGFAGKQIYGINSGTIGFLLNGAGSNNLPPKNLMKRIEAAQTTILHPLTMSVHTKNKETHQALAINEVSLFRKSSQTAHIRISVDGRVRMETLSADGVLLATAAGSSAYNFSAGGPIVPLGAGVLALTPISAFRPRRWRGALLPSSAKVRFEALDPKKRPIRAVADHKEIGSDIGDIIRVDIHEDKKIKLPLLFDSDHGLEERIISEQFQP